MVDATLVVGLDGSTAGERVLEYAKRQATLIGACKIVACFVIEWSPFSFQTAEENAERHKRREEEVTQAQERIVAPAVASLRADGFEVEGIVRHGDAADLLDEIARSHGAAQIIIGRLGTKGLKERIFGGVSGRLIATSSVPVTIIP